MKADASITQHCKTTLTLLVSCMALCSSVLAGEPRTYASLFTPEGRQAAGRTGTYAKDPHVWVYTRAFAKRFGMPSEWIDDDLTGAQALAYRVDYGMRLPSCGYFGEVENCRSTVACVLDMYIADDAELPWNTEVRFASLYARKSKSFLYSQDVTDRPLFLNNWTKRGTRYHLGLDRVLVQDEGGLLGNYSLAEYDRDIYAGLDYLSGTLNCGFADNKRDLRLKVAKISLRKDGLVNYNLSLKQDDSPHIEHIVAIPDSFMRRVEGYAAEVHEPNSLWSELKNRLSSSGSRSGSTE